MADLDATIAQLRLLNEPVPKPMRLPTAREVHAVEAAAGLTFHPDFRRYLLEASDVCFGVLEPVTVADPDAHTHLTDILAVARHWGVPADLIPICEDNGDFYCVTPSGDVVLWSHNGPTDERWPGIAAWIEDGWIGAGRGDARRVRGDVPGGSGNVPRGRRPGRRVRRGVAV